MTQEVIELENLKRQIALLQKEQATTRRGWIRWLRLTGSVLGLWGLSIIVGALPHAELNSNVPPLVIMLILMGLFMALAGVWLGVCSIPSLANGMFWRSESRSPV